MVHVQLKFMDFIAFVLCFVASYYVAAETGWFTGCIILMVTIGMVLDNIKDRVNSQIMSELVYKITQMEGNNGRNQSDHS